jgi:hypothetical protein
MVCALTGHDNTVCSVFARPTVSKKEKEKNWKYLFLREEIQA